MQHLSALLLALALMAGIFALQDSSTADAKDAAPAQMSDKDLAKCLEGKDGGAPAPQGLMGMSPLSGPRQAARDSLKVAGAPQTARTS